MHLSVGLLTGRSMPITLRQLESLIRLSQARARAELREWVTEDDALDVVEMMQESLLDAYTNETGEVDFAHHSGSMSLAKQVGPPMLPLPQATVRISVSYMCLYLSAGQSLCRSAQQGVGQTRHVHFPEDRSDGAGRAHAP